MVKVLKYHHYRILEGDIFQIKGLSSRNMIMALLGARAMTRLKQTINSFRPVHAQPLIRLILGDLPFPRINANRTHKKLKMATDRRCMCAIIKGEVKVLGDEGHCLFECPLMKLRATTFWKKVGVSLGETLKKEETGHKILLFLYRASRDELLLLSHLLLAFRRTAQESSQKLIKQHREKTMIMCKHQRLWPRGMTCCCQRIPPEFRVSLTNPPLSPVVGSRGASLADQGTQARSA